MSLGFTGMANKVLQRSPSILRFSGGLTKMSCVGLLGLDWFSDWRSALGMGDWLWGGRQALGRATGFVLLLGYYYVFFRWLGIFALCTRIIKQGYPLTSWAA
jgi:hypothetical protein